MLPAAAAGDRARRCSRPPASGSGAILANLIGGILYGAVGSARQSSSWRRHAPYWAERSASSPCRPEAAPALSRLFPRRSRSPAERPIGRRRAPPRIARPASRAGTMPDTRMEENPCGCGAVGSKAHPTSAWPSSRARSTSITSSPSTTSPARSPTSTGSAEPALLAPDEVEAIVRGLEGLRAEVEAGTLDVGPGARGRPHEPRGGAAGADRAACRAAPHRPVAQRPGRHGHAALAPPHDRRPGRRDRRDGARARRAGRPRRRGRICRG